MDKKIPATPDRSRQRHMPETRQENGPSLWPRPPAAITAAALQAPPNGAQITVAGLVILRQRPGTANGVIFITLEDETGSVNVIVWRKLFEQFRRAVTSARLMRVTGTVQRANGVTHIIAQHIEDISDMLNHLVSPVETLPTAPETRYD
jgi:single-strand DNA-binding protein